MKALSKENEMETLSVHCDSTVGWDEAVEANETMDDHGNIQYNTLFALTDPRAPARRSLEDPNVKRLRAHLKENNGIQGLEICEPSEVELAVRIFRRDGFVVVRDVLDSKLLEQLRAATSRVLRQMLEDIGPNGLKYFAESGRLPHRYGLGTCSGSRHMAHDPTWAALMDLPTATPMLQKLFGSDDYLVTGCGGECSWVPALTSRHPR